MFKYQLLRLWAEAMSRLYMGLVVATSASEHKLATFNARIERGLSNVEDAAHDAALAAAQEWVSRRRAAHFAIMDAAEDFGYAAEANAERVFNKLDAFASRAEAKHLL